MFLDQIINAVILVLMSIGILLVYSLLLTDVNDKTYEFGMLRTLGLRHSNLVKILMTNVRLCMVDTWRRACVSVAPLRCLCSLPLLTDFAHSR